MFVKFRDTSDAGPFRSRTLTTGDFFSLRIFRDANLAERSAVTEKRGLMRMVSPMACTALHKVQTCGHTTETFVEVSTHDGDFTCSPRKDGPKGVATCEGKEDRPLSGPSLSVEERSKGRATSQSEFAFAASTC